MEILMGVIGSLVLGGMAFIIATTAEEKEIVPYNANIYLDNFRSR